MSDLVQISGISIVCVFNDAGVRQGCLDRSINAYDGPVAVEYLPVDNTENTFRSAGAALNHGARRAQHDVVVFVHQDVYIHDMDRVADVAALLSDDAWGVLGANGVTHEGEIMGRLRDRIELVGNDSPLPTEVDSLDEVMFMVRRDRVVRYPLIEDPDLAWHAYAVEYGLRMRSKGLGVGAVNLAITHNSLSINLNRLDVAHRRVASLHPSRLPLFTTCGRIDKGESKLRRIGILRNHGWRMRWLRESRFAHEVYRRLSVRVVLADICYDVDLLNFSAAAPLHLFNFDGDGGFAEYETGPLRLLRRDRPVTCYSSRSFDSLISRLDDLPASASWLLTGIELDDLRLLRKRPDLDSCVAGVQGTAIWLVGGPIAWDLPTQWSGPRAVPSRALVPNRAVAAFGT